MIQPVYCRHILAYAPEKFTRFARVVFGADTAGAGLDALEALIRDCGLPTKLGQLEAKTPITPEILRAVADSSNIIKCNPRELTHDEIYDILTECL